MDEERDWRIITLPIYEKLRPTGAILRQQFNIDAHGRLSYPTWYVEIEKNEFDYEDPFYDWQSSDSMFETTIELWDDACFKDLSHPSQLAGQTFRPAPDNRLGVFSNSLEISVHKISFGPLDAEAQTMPLRLIYSMTNSGSYAMMNGTLAEHRQESGFIQTVLNIAPPVMTANKELDIQAAIKLLDGQRYATEAASIAENINGVSYPSQIRYAVPYRDLTSLPKASQSTARSSKKIDKPAVKPPWWQFWK